MKKHLKWLIPIVIIIAIVLLSTVSYYATLNDICAVNDYYIIMRDGDGYKLLLTEHGRTFDSGSAFFGPLAFSSVQQMKSKILTGEFTQQEASYLKRLDPGGSLYKYCIDFDDLYEAVLPQGVRQTQIAWSGKFYNFYFSHSYSDSVGYINPIDGSSFRHYREYVNESYYKDQDEDNVYLGSSQISDRNATAHYFSRKSYAPVSTTNYVDLWYELTDGEKTLYVQECFKLSKHNRYVPYKINILGKQGDAYYHIYLGSLKSRPTEDWLLSFGLKPYVE